MKDRAFRYSPTLEELATAQQVGSIDTFDILTMDWPEEEWFEDPLDDLRRDRQSRRAASRRRGT